ncbi:MAG TPA: hypothetical protein PKY25_00245 [Bacilli bacterium]|nr:hypothetical protein [Bacilli bacterium]
MPKTEIIDGVVIVHTGNYQRVHQGYRPGVRGGYVDRGYKEEEMVEMYDKDGNRFYSNCGTLDDAKKLVAKLAEEGKNAIIGPKAPWQGNDGYIPNQSKNDVGVYIIKPLVNEEEQAKSRSI